MKLSLLSSTSLATIASIVASAAFPPSRASANPPAQIQLSNETTYTRWANAVRRGDAYSMPSTKSRRLDLPGLVTGTAGLFFLVYGLIEGNERGWTDGLILAAFVLAAVLLVTFFVVGTFDVAQITPLIERYIASLPSTGARASQSKPLGFRFPAPQAKHAMIDVWYFPTVNGSSGAFRFTQFSSCQLWSLT